MRFSTKRIEGPSGVKKQFWDAVSRAVDAAAQKYLNAIIKEIAPHKKSGDLLLSWRVDKITDGVVEIYSEDPASVWLDQGAQPHHIVPRNKKWLRWETSEIIDPEDNTHLAVFAKHVYHPGNKGTDYIQRAWDSVYTEIDDIMAYGVQEGLDEWIGNIAQVSYMQVSPRTGRVFYGRRGAGGRFISRSAP